VVALGKALLATRSALDELNVEEAEKLLASVEKLPMLPDHAAKFDRVRQMVHYVSEFRHALREASKSFEAGKTINIGSTSVAVVETFPGQDRILLRVTGMNRAYKFSDMPVGLAVGIANEWLDQNGAATLVIKSVYVLARKNSNEEMRAKAREWLQQAAGQLPEIANGLLPLFDDTYELEKGFVESDG
jgi:hypothetical protein